MKQSERRLDAFKLVGLTVALQGIATPNAAMDVATARVLGLSMVGVDIDGTRPQLNGVVAGKKVM